MDAEEKKKNHLRKADCLLGSSSFNVGRYCVVDRGDGSEPPDSPQFAKKQSCKDKSQFCTRPAFRPRGKKQIKKVRKQKPRGKKLSVSTPRGMYKSVEARNIFRRTHESQFKNMERHRSLKNKSENEYNPFRKDLKNIPSFDDLVPEESRGELTIESKVASNEELSDSDKELQAKIRKYHYMCILFVFCYSPNEILFKIL